MKVYGANGATYQTRCPKNATSFFYVELGRDLGIQSFKGHLYYCSTHSRRKLSAQFLQYDGLSRSVISIRKSSEQEFKESTLIQKHVGIRTEFQKMLSRPFMKDKSREEILEIFTSALDEHFTKQMLES